MKKYTTNYLLILIAIIFLSGLYMCCKKKSSEMRQPFTTRNHRCPNVLVQKGSNILLYNTLLANIPGVNPIKFDTLEDYVEFTKWQRSQGIICPILYLQNSINAQGQSVYNVRPDPLDPMGGSPTMVDPSLLTVPDSVRIPNVDQSLLLDASRNDPPYNENSYPGFDPDNQDVGIITPLSNYHNVGSSQAQSANAMDSNWGGVQYSEDAVDAGNYKEDEVYIYGETNIAN